LETQGRAGKPKGVPDADAFIQKWDFKGSRPLMGAGQSPAGFQGRRPWACFPLKLTHMGCCTTLAARLVRLHQITITPLVLSASLAFAALVSVLHNAAMSEPSDPPIRKTVSLPASLWRRIEDFQFAHRVKRDAEAVRRLIELGLEASKAQPPAPGVRGEAK
jgi:hypothetical protein